MHHMVGRIDGRLGGSNWTARLAIAMFLGWMALGFIPCGTASAASSDELSTKVLTQVPIPGLIQTTPGPTNGPIGPSNISFFGGNDGAVAQLIASGGMSGYVRAFVHTPPNGQVVVIEADWVKDQSNIPAILAGVEATAKGPRFDVPGIVDATGFETTSSATTTPQYIVVFSRGNYVFLTLAESADGSLGKSSAVSVASAQAAAVPGTPAEAGTGSGSSNAYKSGEIFGAVLVAVAIIGGLIIAIRKSAGSKKKSVALPASGSVIWPAPITSTPLQVGWHQSGQHFNEQLYWDGRAWTASRQWRVGVGWTESPLTQPTTR